MYMKRLVEETIRTPSDSCPSGARCGAGERRVMLVSSSLLVVLPPLVFETCFASGNQRLAVLGLALLTLPMVRPRHY
jgi:hypothetical protein